MVGSRIFFILLITPLLAGCANIGTAPTHSTDNKTVVNVADSFDYSMSAVNKTKSETYRWENGASQASLDYTGAVQSGSIHIVIQDAAGDTVYDDVYSGLDIHDISAGPGVAGVWNIDLTFEDYSGSLSLEMTADYPDIA